MAEEVSESDTLIGLPPNVEDSNAEDEAEAGEFLHNKYPLKLPKSARQQLHVASSLEASGCVWVFQDCAYSVTSSYNEGC